MRKTISLIGFLAFNFLSTYTLLWMLLILDGTVNGLIIPRQTIENPPILVVVRLVLLFFESMIWLLVTYIINRVILLKIDEGLRERRAAIYTFSFELGAVLSIILYFAIATFAAQ